MESLITRHNRLLDLASKAGALNDPDQFVGKEMQIDMGSKGRRYQIYNYDGCVPPQVGAMWRIETPTATYIMTASKDVPVKDIAGIVRRHLKLKDFKIGQLGWGIWKLGAMKGDMMIMDSRMWGSDGFVHIRGEDDDDD